MDSEWSITAYCPTACSGYRDPDQPQPNFGVCSGLMRLSKSSADRDQTLIILRKELQSCTETLKEFPYDPTHWLARAACLLKLFWPELALGDTYKAQLLLESDSAGAVSTASHRHEATYKFYRTALECFWMIGDQSRAHENIAAGIRVFPKDEYYQKFCEPFTCKNSNEVTGAVLKRAYPWMTSKILRRDKKTMIATRKAMEINTTGTCTLQQVSWEDPPPGDTFGVFALRDIERLETVLIDTTMVISDSDMNERCEGCCDNLTSDRSRLPCCDREFCSAKCAVETGKLFHQKTCGNSFPHYAREARACRDLDSDDVSHDSLLLRVLAIATQHTQDSPLNAPLINQLTATYDGPGRRSFDFSERIVIPIAILRDLGIDVFRNHAYDTWVIQVIMDRLANNRCGDSDSASSWSALFPLFSFFNHACRANVRWDGGEGGKTCAMRLTATRKIEKGEELTISYDTGVECMERRARWRHLAHWMPCGCHCWLCKEEGGEEAKAGAGASQDELPQILVANSL